MSRIIAGAWYGGIRHGAMAGPWSRRNPWQAAPGVSICRSCFAELGAGLNLPNLITIARILLVPVIVWAITSDQMLFAFILFLAAGLSDAVDGFLAKRFGMTSEFGSYLNPLADKALIVSIYIALGVSDALPRWLVILVVSRDIMIVAAVMLSWVMEKPVGGQPPVGSEGNKVAQIVVCTVLFAAPRLRRG